MIQVINRAVDMLDILASAPDQTPGLGELASRLGLNNGTCANILKTLVACGCVDQPERKKGYRLGPKIFQWAGGSVYREDLVAPARHVMAELRDSTNENVILATLNNGNRIVAWEELSSNELQVKRNHVKPIYEATTGRLMFAFTEKAERMKLVNLIGIPSKSVWKEAATAKTLDAELAKIRENGIAVLVTDTHIIGLAVPVSRDGKVIASLGMYLPESRGNKTRLESLKKKLIKAGLELSRQLDANAARG
ncbi:MAG: helix-turn-helix domain-containing protein [Lentisphaerota bacterium]